MNSPNFAPMNISCFWTWKKWCGGTRFWLQRRKQLNDYFGELDKFYYMKPVKNVEKRWTKCFKLKGEKRWRIKHFAVEKSLFVSQAKDLLTHPRTYLRTFIIEPRCRYMDTGQPWTVPYDTLIDREAIKILGGSNERIDVPEG